MNNINNDMSKSIRYTEVEQAYKNFYDKCNCGLIDNTKRKETTSYSKFICPVDLECNRCLLRKKIYKLIKKKGFI